MFSDNPLVPMESREERARETGRERIIPIE